MAAGLCFPKNELESMHILTDMSLALHRKQDGAWGGVEMGGHGNRNWGTNRDGGALQLTNPQPFPGLSGPGRDPRAPRDRNQECYKKQQEFPGPGYYSNPPPPQHRQCKEKAAAFATSQ